MTQKCKKSVKKEASSTKEEVRKEEGEGLRRDIGFDKTNLNVTSAEEMVSWVRNMRVFKKIAFKSEN